MVFARFLPRMMDSSKSLKNPWFLIHFHPKPLKTLGKNSCFQPKLHPGIWVSCQKPSKTKVFLSLSEKNVPKSHFPFFNILSIDLKNLNNLN